MTPKQVYSDPQRFENLQEPIVATIVLICESVDAMTEDIVEIPAVAVVNGNDRML